MPVLELLGGRQLQGLQHALLHSAEALAPSRGRQAQRVDVDGHAQHCC